MIAWLKYNREVIRVCFCAACFMTLNGYLLSREFIYFSYVPYFLLVVMLAIYSVDKLLLLIVFFTPLSIELSYLAPRLEFDAHLPTEPLMLGLLIIVLLKYFYGQSISRDFLLHPVSIFIYLNLLWMLITSVTSTMPLVSIKFLLARVWFLVAFYFVAGEFFRNFKNIREYIWAYTIPLMLLIFAFLYQLSRTGILNHNVAHQVVRPFFNDHTSYGAVLSLLLPVIGGFLFAYRRVSVLQRFLLAGVFGVIVTGLVFSYTRAAWVSIAGAVVIMVLILLRTRFYFLLLMGFILFVAIFSYRSEIILKLEQNRQDSSRELSEHVKSISNVATDASNLERLNRWSCAYRMFRERPVFGWGPGTFMFQYAPFQIARQRTIISTDFATMGNAHSEYIGPLSESGLPGMLTFLGIVLTAFLTGLRVFRETEDRNRRVFGLSVLMGLTTYFIHGIMNNFLDTDKASALFWAFIAILVVFDLQNRREKGRSAESAGTSGFPEEHIPSSISG